jgi:RNA polymerase sigma-70 factor (ECF subfamily)
MAMPSRAERADAATLTAFENAVRPHVRSALALARSITRNTTEAEDVLQEAYVRAFTYFGSFRGDEPRRWFLSIIRNAAYAWLRKTRAEELVEMDDDTEDSESTNAEVANTDTPEVQLIRSLDAAWLNAEIARLPVQYREVLVLRELEDLSYREIADVVDSPIGTVMSRLARARSQLQHAILASAQKRAS